MNISKSDSNGREIAIRIARVLDPHSIDLIENEFETFRSNPQLIENAGLRFEIDQETVSVGLTILAYIAGLFSDMAKDASAQLARKILEKWFRNDRLSTDEVEHIVSTIEKKGEELGVSKDDRAGLEDDIRKLLRDHGKSTFNPR